MSDRIELDDAIAAARQAVGSPEAVSRLRAGLAGRLEAGAGAAEGGWALSAAGAGAGAGKLALLGVVCVIAVGGAAYLVREPAPRPSPPAREPSPIAAVSVEVPPNAATSPEPHPEPEPGSLSVPDAARPRAARRSTGRQVAPVSRQPAAAASEPSEVELVTRAQGLLEAQPSAAKTILLQHEQLYPRGLLREEREVLRIDAELLLGHRERAHELARGFIERYPRSAQVRRLRSLLRSQEPRPAETHPADLEREE